MIRLFAWLHGIKMADNQSGDKAARRSALLGMLTSAVVIVHLVALGASGTYLFLRYGIGYSTNETIFLVSLAVIGVLALGRSGWLIWRRRKHVAQHEDVSS